MEEEQEYCYKDALLNTLICGLWLNFSCVWLVISSALFTFLLEENITGIAFLLFLFILSLAIFLINQKYFARGYHFYTIEYFNNSRELSNIELITDVYNSRIEFLKHFNEFNTYWILIFSVLILTVGNMPKKISILVAVIFLASYFIIDRKNNNLRKKFELENKSEIE